MKTNIFLFFLLAIVAVNQPGFAKTIERTDETSRTLRFGEADGVRHLIVDNLWGAIEVKGYDGDEVQVNVRKTIVARSERKLEYAEKNVTLEISEEDDVIELYVDGPFRDRRRSGFNWQGSDHEGYKVIYDFEIKVPKDCAVELSTVDEGDILVELLEGNFDVHNVNGAIAMKDITGSGDVYTVNGKMLLEFEENPKENCSFGTINGDVRLYFKQGLSADFYMKTMNGEAFTDFEVSSLPGRTQTSNEKNGKSIYKVAHMSGVRAGNGGPTIELDTLNGDMFILSR